MSDYKKYDEVISASITEAYLYQLNNKAESITLTNISPKKISDLVLLKVMAAYSGALSRPVFLKINPFKYLYLKWTHKTTLPYFLSKNYNSKTTVFLSKDSLDFFDRPCKATDTSISILNEIYEEYYK